LFFVVLFFFVRLLIFPLCCILVVLFDTPTFSKKIYKKEADGKMNQKTDISEDCDKDRQYWETFVKTVLEDEKYFLKKDSEARERLMGIRIVNSVLPGKNDTARKHEQVISTTTVTANKNSSSPQRDMCILDYKFLLSSREDIDKPSKKLSCQETVFLVLDLDETLVHTTMLYYEESNPASCCCKQCVKTRSGRVTLFKDAEQIADDMITHTEHKRATVNDDIIRGCNFVSKLRPGVRTMLEILKMDFVLCICSLGDERYVKDIISVIDPTGEIFGDRIITREYIQHGIKQIPAEWNEAGSAVVLDDRIDVWKRGTPVVKIQSFLESAEDAIDPLLQDTNAMKNFTYLCDIAFHLRATLNKYRNSNFDGGFARYMERENFPDFLIRISDEIIRTVSYDSNLNEFVSYVVNVEDDEEEQVCMEELQQIIDEENAARVIFDDE
jgi:hypothetical protein